MQTTKAKYMTSVLDRRQAMALLQFEGEDNPQETIALLDSGAAIILPDSVGQLTKVCDKFLLTNPDEYDVVRKMWK